MIFIEASEFHYLLASVLCRVRERNLVFLPPPLTQSSSAEGASKMDTTGDDGSTSEHESFQAYISANEVAKVKYPWLSSLLNHCNIPIFDITFIESVAAFSNFGKKY